MSVDRDLVLTLRAIDNDIRSLTKTIDDNMRALTAEINSNFNSTYVFKRLPIDEKIEALTDNKTRVAVYCSDCKHFNARTLGCKNGIVLLDDEGCPYKEELQ